MVVDFVVEVSDLVLEASVGADDLLELVLAVLDLLFEFAHRQLPLLLALSQLIHLLLVLLLRLDLVYAELRYLLLLSHQLHFQLLHSVRHLFLILSIEQLDISIAVTAGGIRRT